MVGAGGRAAGRRDVLQLRRRVTAVVVSLLVGHGWRRQHPDGPGNSFNVSLNVLRLEDNFVNVLVYLLIYLELHSKD